MNKNEYLNIIRDIAEKWATFYDKNATLYDRNAPTPVEMVERAPVEMVERGLVDALHRQVSSLRGLVAAEQRRRTQDLDRWAEDRAALLEAERKLNAATAMLAEIANISVEEAGMHVDSCGALIERAKERAAVAAQEQEKEIRVQMLVKSNSEYNELRRITQITTI